MEVVGYLFNLLGFLEIFPNLPRRVGLTNSKRKSYVKKYKWRRLRKFRILSTDYAENNHNFE